MHLLWGCSCRNITFNWKGHTLLCLTCVHSDACAQNKKSRRWLKNEGNAFCILSDSCADLEKSPKTPAGRQILDSFGRDNIFLDQDWNYFMLRISVFLFVEVESVNSVKIWLGTMLRGLEINIRVFQQCCASKQLTQERLAFMSPLSSYFSPCLPDLKTRIFIYKDSAGQPWPDEKFLTELQVWLHPGPVHNCVIARKHQ